MWIQQREAAGGPYLIKLRVQGLFQHRCFVLGFLLCVGLQVSEEETGCRKWTPKRLITAGDISYRHENFRLFTRSNRHDEVGSEDPSYHWTPWYCCTRGAVEPLASLVQW